MRCYFLSNNRIAGVEILPLGLSDEASIASAHTAYAKRKGPFEGFEVWDRDRFVHFHSGDRPGPDPQSATSPHPLAAE